MKRVAEVATGSVYRTTADVINRLTLTSISHQTVGNIIKQVGRGYAEWETSQIDTACSGETAPYQPAVLCIEGDGLLIKGQGAKQQEIHRIQICEGSIRCGKRTQLGTSPLLCIDGSSWTRNASDGVSAGQVRSDTRGSRE